MKTQILKNKFSVNHLKQAVNEFSYGIL